MSTWLMQMGSSGPGNARRPIIPTAASTVAPRQQHLQQQQARYQQAPIYQQSAYSQAPAYYGGGSGRRGGGLAPLGPSMMEVAPVEYRPVRRSDPLGSEMPTYAQHDYRDGPAPNYEVGALNLDDHSLPDHAHAASHLYQYLMCTPMATVWPIFCSAVAVHGQFRRLR